MSVSSSLCEQYLPLLFTTLRDEKISSVRISIVISLGDLCFRFPNSLEPWTQHIYSRLNDDDASLRYNVLTVLTHLVLNDMIKIKGQVSVTYQGSDIRFLFEICR
jgi:condensin complex subunit 1